jgi:hypothetical protein
VLAAELKATLDEDIGALRSLHAGVTGSDIVKDPGAGGGGDSVPVEVPAEVVDYLDQGSPDEAVRHTFGTVLKGAQDIRGNEEATRAFCAAAWKGW